MTARYDGKLSDLVSRYNALERDRGMNPGEMHGWKDKALLPEVEHRFLMVGPRDMGSLFSESQVCYVLGKGESQPVSPPYRGIVYASFDIERRQCIRMPEHPDGKAQLKDTYRIVLNIGGKSHPLSQIRLSDITEDIASYHLRESGCYEKETYRKVDGDNTIRKNAAMLREKKAKNESPLMYARERDAEIGDALTRAVERINDYKGIKERNRKRTQELRTAARKDYIHGIVSSQAWPDEQVAAFAEQHRARIQKINTIEERFEKRVQEAYNGVKGAVIDLKLALMNDDPVIVEAYGITHTLQFRTGRYEGNTSIVSGDEKTVMEIVSSDPRVSPIPLAAVDSIKVSFWKRLEAASRKKSITEPLEHGANKATAQRQRRTSRPVIEYPDIDTIISEIPVEEHEEELVGAGAESRGF
ncbi:hypothetical protein HY497_01570, partial [Candidatus Woesearchaeota archaeon]|nr:hypothetical protein [Candidatus Woesearchaeota archaeon]